MIERTDCIVEELQPDLRHPGIEKSPFTSSIEPGDPVVGRDRFVVQFLFIECPGLPVKCRHLFWCRSNYPTERVSGFRVPGQDIQCSSFLEVRRLEVGYDVIGLFKCSHSIRKITGPE